MLKILIELLQYYVYPDKKNDVWEYKIVKKYDVNFFKRL